MRPLVFLVAFSSLVILGILVYPYVSSAPAPLIREQAVAFVLDDVRPLEGQGVSARVVSAQPDGGRWVVDVLLTRNAHSKCPSVEKRFYTLPPVGFRSESVLNSCNPAVSINYQEEALINSLSFVRGVSDAAYGCAFLSESLSSASSDYASSAEYCPSADFDALASFASDLPPRTWVVVWMDGEARRLAALSSGGQLVKSA